MIGWAATGSAFWFGVLTSISPCPLATNVAAISFIGRKVNNLRQVLLSGLLYSLGRMAAYVVLAVLILAGLLAAGELALLLQQYLNQALGPALILLGMLLLGWFRSTASLTLVGAGMQARAQRGGPGWSLPLGALFALSFCPVSAGLYFGILIPLSAAHDSSLLLPMVYGLGTAAPVLFFAFLMAFASQRLGAAFDWLTRIERVVRILTGLIFILAGVYYSLVFVYELPIRFL